MPLQQIVHTSTPPPITSYRDAIVPGSPHEDVRAFLEIGERRVGKECRL